MKDTSVSLHILGCGNAFASGGRFNTCFYISSSRYAFLLDCGASAIVSARKYGVDLSTIDAIVVSHLHGDHAGGIPFIAMAAKIENKHRRPLKVFGPAGTREVVTHLHKLFFPEAEISMLEFFEYGAGTTESDQLLITAYKAIHTPATNPHSLSITFNNKVIAFSGDTQWHEGLIHLSANADLFICECTNIQTVKNHMAYNDIMMHHSSIKARRVLLTHMDNDMLSMKDCVFERGYDNQKIILD